MESEIATCVLGTDSVPNTYVAISDSIGDYVDGGVSVHLKLHVCIFMETKRNLRGFSNFPHLLRFLSGEKSF